MERVYRQLMQLLEEIPECLIEGKPNKDIIAELARQYDLNLINKLLSNKITAERFFTYSDAGVVFKKIYFCNLFYKKSFCQIRILPLNKGLV